MNMDIPGNMMDIPNNVLNSIIPGHHHVDFPQDGDPNFTKTVTIEGPKGNKMKVEKWVSKDGSKTFQRMSSIDSSNPSVTKTFKKKVKKTLAQLKQELEKALQEEFYEQAAIIRDEIKNFKPA
jgi:excinuclease UvrABC helicase subunit UvrB